MVKNVNYESYFFVHYNNEVRFMENKFVVTGSKEALNNMKYEIARELGVTLGADTSSKMNGSVGGYMTKRLVELGMQSIR